MNHPIPILLYHRIEDSDASTATSPQAFRQHLEMLSEQGWKSLSADEFSHAMTTGRAAPSRSFLITFDDGYETVRTAALDVLRDFDFKAISFLSTRLLRNAQASNIHNDDENLDAYMTWDQVRELQSSGLVDCQSHSHTHSSFTGCAAREIRQDLATSVELLASELRLPHGHFNHLAWPWGLSTAQWREVASELGFKFQYTVSRQACRLDSPRDQIPRTCFDANSFAQFQRSLWLQSGRFSQAWDIAYPVGRKLRRLVSFARG